MTIVDGDLMTPPDAARALGVSRAMMDKLCVKKRLPVFKTVGGIRLMWARDVEALRVARAKAKRQRKARSRP